MSKSADQKIKLLVLYDILCRYTDGSHAMNTDEIIKVLKERGIAVARKVLPLDIALLNEYGYEVLSYKKKYHYYYVVSRQFDTAEIGLLSDVIKASKLAVKQKQELIRKLVQMTGNYQAKLSENIIHCDTPKRSNVQIIYSIDTIAQAIKDNRRISFLYYALDIEKKKVYRREGKRYIVNPLVMVWNKDNYYLICYDDSHDGTANYRIDRMERVEIEGAKITPREEFENFDVEQYRMQVFSMFGGELQKVKINFLPSLLDEIYDKFGEDIKVTQEGDTYAVTTEVQISPTFFAWVAGSRGKIRISSPNLVYMQFNNYIEEIKTAYSMGNK